MWIENISFSLLTFFVFGLILALFIKKKAISFFIFTLFSLLTLIDLASLFILSCHINFFTFYKSLNWTLIKVAPFVVPEILIPIFMIILLFILIFWIFAYLRKYVLKLPSKQRLKIFLILLLIFLPLFLLSKTTIAYKNITKQISGYIFKKEVNTLLFDKNKYVPDEAIKATKGKNLVVIYVESFENTFLAQKELKNLIPNIQKLINNGWNQYANYNELEGTNNTISALYATQTSFPVLFSGNFSTTKKVSIISWSKVLKKAGYKNIFLSADQTDFLGKEELMAAFGYEVKNDTIIANQDNTPWKAHDQDLFEAAKKQYLELLKSPPFNLTVLTVDTHFPTGHPDIRMQKRLGSNIADGHKFTFKCLDYLLKDFFDFIYKQPGSQDTIIVIMGDHLLMGNELQVPILKELKTEKRTIMLLTNKEIKGYEKDSPIYYYDIPRIILNLAEVKHNAAFSKDLIPNMSEDFTKKNFIQFKGLNVSAMETYKVKRNAFFVEDF